MVARLGELQHNGPWAPLTTRDLGEPSALERANDARDADVRLRERLVLAEPAAIDEVYRAHHAVLRAYAQRLIGEQAAAEDLVHDVFVSLPKLMRRFRAESSLRSFMLGIATNLGTRHVRKTRRRRALLARFGDYERTETRTPETELVHDERRLRLYRALDTLSMEQRAAFVLCEIEERSAAEAAEILDIPEGTVRTRCFHARKRLLQQLQRSAP